MAHPSRVQSAPDDFDEGMRVEETRERRRGRRHTVLIVDDEARTVSAVRHLLRRRYKVLGATRAAEALEMMKTENVSVVLSDQRMPEMTGDVFLAEVCRLYPDTVRILITAYADMQALIRNVNQGQIFGFVAKPWTAEELERMVDTAIAYRQVVDEKRAVAAELAQANTDLTRANEELRAFTHVVAHDLKEPLRTIGTYANFLEQDCAEQLDGPARSYLDGITRCAKHLHQLIDDLLKLSELDHLEPTLVNLPLASVITQALEFLEGRTQAANAQIEVDPELPQVRGDPQRLVMVFQNLISNGIKFNNSAEPRVQISAQPADNGMVEVTVADNGIGIEPQYVERIFGLFERLHSRSEFPGTGAGLAIVKKIVDGHGGGIRVEASAGAGTRFTITLPAAKIPREKPERRSWRPR